MDETGFLDVADALSTGLREAEWRSAISRAYYAAFHKARRVLRQCGFTVPRGDQAHAYLWLRLSNSAHPDVVNTGLDMNNLRSARNWADYDLDQPLDQAAAMHHVLIATDIIRLLDLLATEAAVRVQVVDAIKIYERDVLGEATWHP